MRVALLAAGNDSINKRKSFFNMYETGFLLFPISKKVHASGLQKNPRKRFKNRGI